MYTVIETKEYKDWFNKQNAKEQGLIHSRISRIRLFGHFGLAKKLDRNLAELKWSKGRRIYFSVTMEADGRIVVLLLGGNKNKQQRDIEKAKNILMKLCKDD